jgi:glycosyltransferase involved in cell wall biosynthesis
MKIIVVLSRVPFPLEKGDKLRAYHQLVHLAKSNDIYLFCLSDIVNNLDSIAHLKSFCKEVHVFKLKRWKIALRLFIGLFNKLPFQVSYFFDRNINSKLRNQITRIEPDRIYCQLIRTCEYVKDLHGINKTLDYMDAFSKGMERRLTKANFISKYFIKTEQKRLLIYENRIFDYFEKKIIISEQDRNLIHHKDKNKIQIIPNGVDSNYFKPVEFTSPKYDLLFHGNLNYAPNIECVRYIIEEILPQLNQKNKNYSLLVSGAAPSSRVIKLCESDKNITLTANVVDVRNSYSNAKILIAPFTSGTGLQNKLLEGMAMGIPCITSDLCFNALENAVKNEDILVGENTLNYVNLISKLMNDTVLQQKISYNGRAYVVTHYTWQKANQLLENLIAR